MSRSAEAFHRSAPFGEIGAADLLRRPQSGLYGAYDPAATDGRQALAGLVYAEAAFTPGTVKVPAALAEGADPTATGNVVSYLQRHTLKERSIP